MTDSTPVMRRASRRAARLEVGVVESGSNLLVADVGVRGLVVKPDKKPAEIDVPGTAA